MRLRRIGGAAGLVAAVLVVAGCGGEKTGEVTGTVTVDGQPAPTGSSISFVPGGGATIESGKYTVTKLPTGTAKVRITVPKFATGKVPPPKAGPGPGGEGERVVGELVLVDESGQSEWTYDVKPGPNEKNWVLKSKDK